MKKIGLVTCYVDNFGACLQAYALQTSIAKNGCECEIIQYIPYMQYYKQSLSAKAVSFLKKCNAYIRYPSRTFAIARNKYFNKFRRKYLKFAKDEYKTISELYKSPPKYDAFVCGSDQLWNPVIHDNKNNKAYFLDFAPNGIKRIAYAPSIGIDTIPENCVDDMRELLCKMDVLSTREATGSAIVEKLTNRECRTVLDPTLLLTSTEWSELAVTPSIKKPYIFCYLFGSYDYIGEFVEYAKKQLGYEVYLVPFVERDFNGPDNKIKNAGPCEFLGLIKDAALVITDSFHATAFSINFNVPFYSLLRNGGNDENNMNSRLYNILEMVKLENRLITSKDEFPEKVSTDVDFTQANDILSKRRLLDSNFLKDSLK